MGGGMMAWGLMPLSWRKPEYPEKTTDLPQVTDKLYYIMLYRVHLHWAGLELTTLVVIDTDYMHSYKSNYNTITTTVAPSNIVFLSTYTKVCIVAPPCGVVHW